MTGGVEKSSYKVLLNSGAISKEKMDALLAEAESTGVSFSRVVVKSGLISESRLLDIYARSLDVPRVSLRTASLEKELIDKVPVKIAAYYKFFPVKLVKNKLTIAVSNILDVNTLDEIRFSLGFEIEIVFAPAGEVEEKIKELYGLGAGTVDKILSQQTDGEGQEQAQPETEIQNIEKLAETASVVELVNQIIWDAFRNRASDIHLEPHPEMGVRIRYRIDGILQEAKVPQEMKRFFSSILSRFKIMANLNIVEKRLPQDGKARVKTEDQTVDLRISSIPTVHGEGMVIRILPGKMVLTPNQLGFEPENLEIFNGLIKRPYGILFATGPTGSGKTTTLYAALNVISTVERKIITIEDPVEYELPGISQIQVNPEIGLTFARGLRSMLRHDPDVMMVGEVRDFETADTAIRAALTGHLMLSTLHTNDAASGVTRLLDIGVEPYLVASSVIGFVAQRLIRVICPACKTEDAVTSGEVKGLIAAGLNLAPGTVMKIHRGVGCDECGGTGYRGRMPVHEILPITEPIRRLIIAHASAEAIKAEAVRQGMNTLRRVGWKKVLKGLTTTDEVLQVTPADETAAPVTGTMWSFKSEAAAVPVQGGGEPHADDGAFWVSNDRRKYERIKVNFGIRFRKVDQESPEGRAVGAVLRGRGEVENLSAGGIYLTSEQALNTGDLLELEIGLPDGQEPIRCLGKVLRVDRDEQPEGAKALWRVAVSFVAIESTWRLRLEKFCRGIDSNEKI